MSRFHRFQGLYWRQMFITVGMVLLTLMLLGASFGSLSYNYARSQKSGEIRTKAVVMSQLSVNYLESGRFLTIEELQNDRDFRQLASFAATVSDVHFMICDREGHVLLSTDKDLTGMTVTMPAKMTREIMEQGETSARDDLGGLYENKRFVVGVPAVNPTSGEVVGEVFAVSTSASLDAMWQGFVGLFFMTALVVLMISFMASSVTTMRQIQPIREMAAATRQYAEGNFDIRMNDYGRDDDLLLHGDQHPAHTLADVEVVAAAQRVHDLELADVQHPPDHAAEATAFIGDDLEVLPLVLRRNRSVQNAVGIAGNGGHRGLQLVGDIGESMRRVLISMEKKINDRHLDVDADIPEEPILVLGDNDMITQVIYNLLENAAKFAREGSTLYLGVTTIDGKARVTVRNVGDTIPAEELPLLFERFHKSDKSRSEDKDGVGLGLYIVKTILEQHRETIRVTSENGVTAFTFSLTTE